MITIHELLRDPQYRAYFLKAPKLPDHYTPEMKPWKLAVLKHGESVWRTKRFGTYREAFEGLKKMLPTIADGAIISPALGFMPPTRTVRVKGKIDPKTKKQLIRTTLWRPQLDGDEATHYWCPHCRRPTIWKVAGLNRPARDGFVLPKGEPINRCTICGTSERVVDLRHPENNEGWNINRVKVTAA